MDFRARIRLVAEVAYARGLNPRKVQVRVLPSRLDERKEAMVNVEIRSAEGGLDAKLLVRELLGIYLRVAKRRGL